MTQKDARKLLIAIGVLVLAFLIFVGVFGNMPYVAASPAGAWEKFVTWNAGVISNVIANIQFYGLVGIILFVGGWVSTKNLKSR
jgi:hypothetical protein